MNKELEKRRLKAGAFVSNNGAVMLTINLLREKYNKLGSVQTALKQRGISLEEFIDSVNFLTEEGYLNLRDIALKEPVSLADANYTTIEAKLTGKAIRLLGGGFEDNMIEV